MSAEGWAANETFSNDDWDKTSTATPPPPEPGVYVAKIVAADKHMSGGGKAGAKIEVQLLALRGGASLERPRKLTDFVTVSKDGMFKVKQYSQACGGLANPGDNSSEAIIAWCSSLVGCDVIVKVRPDSYMRGSEKIATARVDRPLTSAEADQAQGLTAAPEAAAATGGGRRRNGAAA